MSTVTEALLVNAVVLIAVLEADLGSHRKIGRARIVRPVIMAAAIVPLFLQALTTHGNGLTLEVAGAVAGAVLGLLAVSLMTVYRSPRTGKTVSRSGFGYAALWTVVIAGRSAFSYGSEHWFRGQLGTWMIHHNVSTAAITDTMILMAVAMVVTRTVGLVIRSSALPAAASLVGAAQPVLR